MVKKMKATKKNFKGLKLGDTPVYFDTTSEEPSKPLHLDVVIHDLRLRVYNLEQRVKHLEDSANQTALATQLLASADPEYISGRWHKRSGDIYGRTDDQARDLRAAVSRRDRHQGTGKSPR